MQMKQIKTPKIPNCQPSNKGPYGIGRSLGPYPDDPGLQAGMVISNEPGYYKPGEFGKYIGI